MKELGWQNAAEGPLLQSRRFIIGQAKWDLHILFLWQSNLRHSLAWLYPILKSCKGIGQLSMQGSLVNIIGIVSPAYCN